MASPHGPHTTTYAPVETVPDGLTWKPAPHKPPKDKTILYSMGNIYKLVRDRVTGEVAYFMREDADNTKSPASAIDAEPAKPKQVRYNTGKHCWFVDTDNRWYCCEVVERKQTPDRITIRPVTGWDAERVKEWPYSELLEFPAKDNNPLFKRLRPLKARR